MTRRGTISDYLSETQPMESNCLLVLSIQQLELSCLTAFSNELESFVYSLYYYRRYGLLFSKTGNTRNSSFRLYYSRTVSLGLCEPF
ncbi:unnamed protein product (mitochondrion) [Musa textilis]